MGAIRDPQKYYQNYVIWTNLNMKKKLNLIVAKAPSNSYKSVGDYRKAYWKKITHNFFSQCKKGFYANHLKWIKYQVNRNTHLHAYIHKYIYTYLRIYVYKFIIYHILTYTYTMAANSRWRNNKTNQPTNKGGETISWLKWQIFRFRRQTNFKAIIFEEIKFKKILYWILKNILLQLYHKYLVNFFKNVL